MPVTSAGFDLKLPSDAGPAFAPLDAWRQSLDSAARAYANEVQEAVRTYLKEGPSFEDVWRLICRAVLDGKTTEMQAGRERFLAAFERRLHQLQNSRPLVQFAERIAGRDLPVAKQLEAEAEALERKLSRVAERWQTAEDLEDLAAESIELPPGKLEAIRRKHGYPHAWYEEDSKPF